MVAHLGDIEGTMARTEADVMERVNKGSWVSVVYDVYVFPVCGTHGHVENRE